VRRHSHTSAEANAEVVLVDVSESHSTRSAGEGEEEEEEEAAAAEGDTAEEGASALAGRPEDRHQGSRMWLLWRRGGKSKRPRGGSVGSETELDAAPADGVSFAE
jgi:hypothetical protein